MFLFNYTTSTTSVFSKKRKNNKGKEWKSNQPKSKLKSKGGKNFFSFSFVFLIFSEKIVQANLF